MLIKDGLKLCVADIYCSVLFLFCNVVEKFSN